jgi:hypothetical protein
MRKPHDGLSALVRNPLGADPMDGRWYAFIIRRRQQMNRRAGTGGRVSRRHRR